MARSVHYLLTAEGEQPRSDRRFVLLIAFSPGKSIERHSFIHLPRESWCGLISFFPSFSSPLSVEACLAQADGNTLKMPPIENDTGKNELKTRIQDLIDSNQVLVFSKSYCPYCVKVRYSFCRRGGGPRLCRSETSIFSREVHGLGLIAGLSLLRYPACAFSSSEPEY